MEFVNGSTSTSSRARWHPAPGWRVRAAWTALGLGLAWLLAGCAIGPRTPLPRPFEFGRDNVAYTNELVWEYEFNSDTGESSHHPRSSPPTYSHHCFVVTKSVQQFFLHARFDPVLPKADAATYRRLIRRVVGRDPARKLPEDKKIVIPGYADLHAFSIDQEQLLKEECSGAWRSYFQRGHWRMIMPFSRRHQERTAQEFLDGLKINHPAVVHLVRFPSLKINHCSLIYAAQETSSNIVFRVFDPNTPALPQTLTYDRSSRTFDYSRNPAFIGGRVDVYQIYYRWNY